MRFLSWLPWRRGSQDEPKHHEGAAHLAATREREVEVAELTERAARIIATNHLAPKIHAALRERRS